MSDSIELRIRDAYQFQKHQKCVELIDSLPTVSKETSQYRILKASCLNNIPGRSTEALAILDLVIETDPNPNPLAMFGKGLCFINQGDFTSAVKCFERAIELEPSEKMDKARAMKERAEKMMLSMMSKRREPPKNNDIIVCKVCGKNFTKHFSLVRHMLLHTGERPFQCSICKYGFIQKSDLLRHEATHKAEFNFHCLYCTKRFKTKKNLQCHLTTHKDDRPFKCPKCPKSFKLLRLLNFHIGTHQGFVNFHCDQCDMSFLAKPILLAHIQECHSRTEGNIALEPLDIKPEPVDINPMPMEMDESCGINHEGDAEKFNGAVRAQQIKIKLEPGLQESSSIIHEKLIKIKPEPIDEPALIPETCVTDEVTMIEEGEESSYGERFYAPIIDPDMEFLRSLVKDVKRMDEKQKDEFQRKVRSVIDAILE